MSMGNVASPIQRQVLYPVTALVATSINYLTQINLAVTNFPSGAADQYVIPVFNRSNAGVAMTDSLPAPSNRFGDLGPLPNGWSLVINNVDTIASITLTPVLPATIDGLTSISIEPSRALTIFTDGFNYFSVKGASNGASYSPVKIVTGSPIALGTYTSGAIIERSNATVAMADTLPNANTLPAGWWIEVFNVDASAADTITPATSTINGASTLVIAQGQSSVIRSNGTNYIATTPA